MREGELITYYLDVLLTMLTTPIGVAMLVMFMAMVVAAATIPGTRWYFLTAAIY
ncbi:MAG: hypothetical protein JWM57_3601, partial [Phycisphaerales bacterium]|nr:hypothetical protein [Phycisphaerales bacterium]